MKTLLFLRHAKSSWKDGSLDDHERPLNKRGRKAAAKMGRLIQDHDLLPNLILCSSAIRARETCELAIEGWNRPAEIQYLDELYLCPADRFVPALRRIPADVERVLLIGHNPGMLEFLESATGAIERFPTAALAWLTAEIDAWSDMDLKQPLHLKNLWRPRDVE